MTYEVVWTPDAERELAALWVAATDRAAVSTSSHQIDRALGRAPLTYGESRAASVSRVAAEGPLAVTFEVIEDDKRVFVHAVFASG